MSQRLNFPTKPNNNGSWRFSIGFELRGGQKKTKQFNLGSDRRVAERKYIALWDYWENEVTGEAGEKLWTTDLIRLALESASPTETPPVTQKVHPAPLSVITTSVTPTIQAPSVEMPKGLTLHDGLRLYLDAMERKATTGDISRRWYLDLCERVNKVMAKRPDRPLAELNTLATVKEYLR